MINKRTIILTKRLNHSNVSFVRLGFVQRYFMNYSGLLSTLYMLSLAHNIIHSQNVVDPRTNLYALYATMTQTISILFRFKVSFIIVAWIIEKKRQEENLKVE